MPLHGSPRTAMAGALRATCLAIVVLVLTTVPFHASAAPMGQTGLLGETIFQQKCAACHTIGGGKLVGPDLQGVTTRRDPVWLKEFIAAPDKVLASGDPLAAQLLQESNNVPMPNLGLSSQEVDELLAFMGAKDGAAAPANGATPAPAPVQAAPATAPNGSADQGQLLFTGRVRLAGGGTACIACHSVEGSAALGGGALGPDLTQVYTRYTGQGLAAALASLPFPSMQSIYATRQLAPEEQADLLAFFARADQSGRTPLTQRNLLMILGGGGGLAGLLFVGLAFFWPRQRMSISRRLRKYGKL